MLFYGSICFFSKNRSANRFRCRLMAFSWEWEPPFRRAFPAFEHSVPHYAECRVSTLALAGKREASDIQDSVRFMAERNPLCTFQLWERARHNIPLMFADRFNQTLCSFFEEE